MMDLVKRLLGKSSKGPSETGGQDSEHNIRVAVCALFVEMARIDGTFSKQELDTLITILENRYSLSPEHAQALITAADEELEESVDLWQFARLINEHYAIDEKIEVIEILWRIVYVDGKMDAHEHYLMNKLSNLLRLSHNQLIDAKLKVLHNNRHGRNELLR